MEIGHLYTVKIFLTGTDEEMITDIEIVNYNQETGVVLYVDCGARDGIVLRAHKDHIMIIEHHGSLY